MRVALWLLQDSIRHWAGWVAGLHYVRNCLEGLSALPSGQAPEVVAFVSNSLKDKLINEASFADASWLRLHTIDDDWLNDLSRRDELADEVRRQNCDVLFPAITPPAVTFDGKCVGWITDLQHKHYPQFFADTELRYRDALFAFLAASCTRIVCSSETVEADLKSHFAQVEDRTFVLRFRTRPPNSALVADPSGVLEQLGLDQPYAYLPYQFWQHKNHRVVFQALAKLKQQGQTPLLVCSGAMVDARDPEHVPALKRFIKEQGLEEQVRLLGMVPREQQWQLYRGAKMIVQPSLFEGWSTSVEEARSLGKSVLLSDIAIHREQLNQTGFFFDPNDSESLADLFQRCWRELPDGFDEDAEHQALVANQASMRQFGEDLLRLFDVTLRDDRTPITASVLPLLLSAQVESEKRLEVIRDLTAQKEDTRPAAVHGMPVKTRRRRWLRR